MPEHRRYFRHISIHALREEGDVLKLLFTSSDIISIHALREEGDFTTFSAFAFHEYFYPRPPRGGRHVVGQGRDLDDGFLSTPSARRATELRLVGCRCFLFLSTPSARRATNTQTTASYTEIFLSTPSARRATTAEVWCFHPPS